MITIDTLHPAVTAADYAIAALGDGASRLLLTALRAGWLTPAEAEELEPLAAALAWLLEAEVPAHRGVPARIAVCSASERDVAAAVARAVRP